MNETPEQVVEPQAPTQAEIEKCYGTLRDCPRKDCCPIAEACASRANEDGENIKWQRRHISIPFMDYNSGDSVGKNNRGRSSLSNEEHDAERQAFEITEGADDNGRDMIDIGGVSISASSYEDVRKVTDAICGLAITAPYSFSCLVKRLYNGERQIDIASGEGKSRQAVNKKLLAELGIAQQRKTRKGELLEKIEEETERRERAESALDMMARFFAGLSLDDFMIFKLLMQGWMNEAGVARAIGVSPKTVFNAKRRFSNAGVSFVCDRSGDVE